MQALGENRRTPCLETPIERRQDCGLPATVKMQRATMSFDVDSGECARLEQRPQRLGSEEPDMRIAPRLAPRAIVPVGVPYPKCELEPPRPVSRIWYGDEEGAATTHDPLHLGESQIRAEQMLENFDT